MGLSQNVSPLNLAGFFSVPLIAGLTLLPISPVRGQDSPQPDGFDRMDSPNQPGETLNLPTNAPTESVPQESVSPPEQTEAVNPAIPAEDPENSEVTRPLETQNSLLSMEGGQRLIEEARAAAQSENYEQAVNKLQQSREIFNQLSNFHQQLYDSFTGIDNRIAESQRQSAVESAEMRDLATYELAIVHRAQNRPELAVPLLIQIIRSQQPTRDLGKKAYQQLWELGFVESPYPAAPASSNSSGR